jgi:DNA-directed RNA polymerase sigma subunit (sigma70/sigma32)
MSVWQVICTLDEAAMEINDPDDPVAFYLREVANVPPLPKDGEAELFRQLGHSGNWSEQQENVARRLIESQLALVVAIAERHLSSGILSMLELIQEGNIGLMKAVESFARRPVGDFSAHATACIETAIARAESDLKQNKH